MPFDFPVLQCGEAVMRKRRWIIGALVPFAIVVWYLFRPELLFIDRVVQESLPLTIAGDGRTAIVASGDFHSVAHESQGHATIYETGDGERVLRLTNFATSNGPDVWVYLVAADDADDSATVKQAGYVELGSLHGNEGDQNYPLPANLDIGKYRAVTIWCRRFSVNFATAPLKRPA
jgi:hypothetical protein